MQDLLKQSASEFKAKFIEDTVMTGVRLVERSDGKAILDWHTKQMEKAYEAGYNTRTKETNSGRLMYQQGREDERKENIEQSKTDLLNALIEREESKKLEKGSPLNQGYEMFELTHNQAKQDTINHLKSLRDSIC